MPADFEWEHDGEWFIELVRQQVTEPGDVSWLMQSSGFGWAPWRPGMLVFSVGKPDGSRGENALAIVRSPHGFGAFIAHRPGASANDEAFLHKVERAVESLAGHSVQVEWWAVIGIIGRYAANGQRLTTPVNIGKMHLARPEIEFVELVTDERQLGVSETRWSWPVIVHGSASIHLGRALDRRTAPELHRLCSLLTLTTGYLWAVRSRAHTWAPVIPHHAIAGPALDANRVQSDLELPGWIDDSWERLNQDEDLRRLVDAFQEVIAAEAWHPSYALVGAIGVIEAMGKRPGTPPAGEGSRARFLRVLAAVAPWFAQADAAEIYKHIRSATAHSGVVHGPEGLQHSPTPPPLFGSPDDPLWFHHKLIPLRNIARDLLMRAIRGFELSVPTD
jgi:hypothetical protein